MKAPHPVDRPFWPNSRHRYVSRSRFVRGSDVALPADATDVRAQLAKVKAANPAFIFAAVHYPEGGVLLRQAKELGITSTIIGTDGGHDPQLLKIAGSAADGSYWVTIGWGDSTSNAIVSGFIDKYRKRYGEEPNRSPCASKASGR